MERIERVLFPSKFRYKEGYRQFYPAIALNDNARNAREDFPTNEIRSTKYSAFTFVPKVLLEQFRKVTTVYFLLITIISLIPSLSPLTPWTTVSGFLFILIAAAVREAYEDFLRFKADFKANRKMYTRIDHSGSLEQTRSKDIRVGDTMYITRDQEVPADIVIISTSNPSGICYIETAQLDGETNLKPRKAPSTTSDLTKEQVVHLKGELNCEPPKHILNAFSANLVLEGGTISLNQDNLLLKSTVLRNTAWIIGVVAYAGPETKQVFNSKSPPSKMSSLDNKLNLYVLGIFVFKLLLCISMALLSGIFAHVVVLKSWYLDPGTASSSWEVIVRNFFAYFALMSYLIPLSLVVSLELIKVVQSKFMEWDKKMLHDGLSMVAKTSNLNDELGLVEYIFSDKTGTLTENKMVFAKCSVGGKIYVDKKIPYATENEIAEFLLMMALCHSVIPDTDNNNNLIYNATSPDEEALVKGAARNGVQFIGRRNNHAIVAVNGNHLSFEILATMEFTSDRRRMSIIVRCPDGTIKLWIKGSDAVIMERIHPDCDPSVRKSISDDLHEFSKEGLRTLVFAKRTLDSATFSAFQESYNRANSVLTNREEEVEAVCDGIERYLDLVGASAIEDKLQEFVPETIQYLLDMRIRVWVITGDKQETAINIGYSSKLISQSTNLVIMNVNSAEECADWLRNHNEQFTKTKENTSFPYALVIDGSSLLFAIHDHGDEFIKFAQICHAVICCRVTPIQKASVVKLVNEKLGAVTLAIGDGANDVSMIQEANVGVGIFGKEGTQAALASDFALRRFHHLQRLIAIHGRYSLIRSATVIHYSFYKNAAIFLVQIWFAFYSGFSAQTIYDDWVMTFFNIVITSGPPMIYGVFEKDLSEKLINKHPAIYNRTQSKRVFTPKTLFLWLLFAVYHSIVLFFGSLIIFTDEIMYPDGKTGSMRLLGNVIMSIGIPIIFFKLALETSYWTVITHASYWGALGFYFLVIYVESFFVEIVPDQYYIFPNMIQMPAFFLWLLLAPALCLLPDLTVKLVQISFWPEDWQKLLQKYRIAKRAGSGETMISESPWSTSKPLLDEITNSLVSNNEDLHKPLLDSSAKSYNGTKIS